MITGIAHLAFHITDLDRSLQFYCKRLGFQEAFRLDREGEHSPWIVYLQAAPGQFLELFPGATASGEQGGVGVGYNHFCLRVDDMKATLRQLTERGMAIDGDPAMGLDGNWQYWITDPDGNRIELMQIMPGSPQAQAEAHWSAATASTVA